MRCLGMARAALAVLLPLSISANDDCEDSAYIQRPGSQQQPMTPNVDMPSFLEVAISASPQVLQCGAGDMYNFGGPENDVPGAEPQCMTVAANTPFATHCSYSQFQNREFESTCWWPYQAGSDYCADTFEPRASNQVTLEGLLDAETHNLRNDFDDSVIGQGDNKSACFTMMPPMLCPRYVCVSAGGLERYCYETSGKSCVVRTVDGSDSVECSEWNVGDPFCIASLAEEGDQIKEIQNFAIQWDCCQSGGSTGDPHVTTLDGKHYILLQEGTFKLWSVKNFVTEYLSAEKRHELTPQVKKAEVDWQIYAHYSTGRSFAKGILLVDNTLGQKRQSLELTSETCRWRSRIGEQGQWADVQHPTPLFVPDGADFVTGFNMSSTGRKNGHMDVRLMLNTKYGIKRIATLKISCKPGHHINSKLRLDKRVFSDYVAGQIRPGRSIVSEQMDDKNISQTINEMRKMSNLQMMQDQEFFVTDPWEKLGGSSDAANYFSEVDDQLDGARTLVNTCSGQEEEAARKMCVKWMGARIVNSTASKTFFTDCIFDVCAGGGEVAAELAAEIMREDDY